jgi:signal transduction histidine kinase
MRVDELVRESLVLNKAFGERFKVSFQSQGDIPQRQVHADRKRLLQVMTNLLSNAAKFSPEGAAVGIDMQANGAMIRVAV